MSFLPSIGRAKRSNETWLISFAGNTGGGLGTSAVKAYGTIYRTQGGSSVATGTLPFSLSINEAAVIVDLWINAAISNGGEFQFDIEIGNTSQKLFWPANSMLFSSNSRPRLPAPGIPIAKSSQVSFAAYWIIAQTTTTVTNVFALAMTQPVRA